MNRVMSRDRFGLYDPYVIQSVRYSIDFTRVVNKKLNLSVYSPCIVRRIARTDFECTVISDSTFDLWFDDPLVRDSESVGAIH